MITSDNRRSFLDQTELSGEKQQAIQAGKQSDVPSLQ
jgi:hypothetical protein